jgi:hypothetical protein
MCSTIFIVNNDSLKGQPLWEGWVWVGHNNSVIERKFEAFRIRVGEIKRQKCGCLHEVM